MIGVFASTLFLFFIIHRCILRVLVELRLKGRGSQSVPLTKRYLRGIRNSIFPIPMALAVAVITGTSVFGISLFDTKSVLSGLALLALMFGHDPLEWKFTPEKYKKRIADFVPRTTQERMLWVVCSLVAGVGEEIIFRAVLFQMFFNVTGSYWISGIISAVIFAINHIGYGLLGVLIIFFVALGLQWLVKISGGLYLAIGVHFIYDLLYGIIGGILIKPRTAEEPASDAVLSSTTANLDPASPSPAQTSEEIR